MRDEVGDTDDLRLARSGPRLAVLPAGGTRMTEAAHRPDPVVLTPLLGAVASGDAAALEQLYRLTSGRLLAIARHFLGPGDDAEDVLHDVYVTVWKKASMYDAGRARPMAWMTSITRNRCIDRLRMRARRPHADPQALAAVPDETDDAQALVEREEQGRRLLDCMDRLSSDQRHAIRQAFYRGQTYEAVARNLDVPLPTLKSRIRRALILMRQCLQS